MNDVVTIAVVSNEKYLKHLYNLLRSLELNKNIISISICLLNIKKKQLVSKKLNSIYSNVYIDFVEYEDSFSPNETKALAANHRVIFINQLLKKHFKTIFYLDCDSIVRANLKEHLNELAASDISIIFRHNHDERSKVAAGAILFQNNSNTKEFLKRWVEKIQPIKNYWFADQITFYETYLETKHFIDFKNLRAEMNDWSFNDKSMIWAGKGNRKRQNLIYLLEQIKNKSTHTLIKDFIHKAQNILRDINLYKET